MLHEYVKNTRKSVLPEFLRNEYSKDIKELIYENRDKITCVFGEFDIKKLFGAYVDCRIKQSNGDYNITRKKSLAVFNLANGEYCYI
jgi:hypothetical protein